MNGIKKKIFEIKFKNLGNIIYNYYIINYV